MGVSRIVANLQAISSFPCNRWFDRGKQQAGVDYSLRYSNDFGRIKSNLKEGSRMLERVGTRGALVLNVPSRFA